MAADKSRNSTPMDKLWQDVTPERLTGEAGLVIDVAGFEGPLDLLLHLARTQKVDLSRISVLALAEQYLQFVESARRVRIEAAADYLVMAAWLAFLKSKLLIPQQSKDEGPSGEEMAATLAFRLKRLEAMREAAERLVNRARLGRDVFARGARSIFRISTARPMRPIFTICSAPMPICGSVRRLPRSRLKNGRSGRLSRRASF